MAAYYLIIWLIAKATKINSKIIKNKLTHVKTLVIGNILGIYKIVA